MENWIPFEEGEYWIEIACLFSSRDNAAMLEQATLEIYLGRNGRLYMKGSGKIKNMHIVELLEDSDDLHLLLDLGGEFKYRMDAPDLHGGKVFSPEIKAVVQFVPQAPWEQITEKQFEDLIAGFSFVE